MTVLDWFAADMRHNRMTAAARCCVWGPEAMVLQGQQCALQQWHLLTADLSWLVTLNLPAC